MTTSLNYNPDIVPTQSPVSATEPVGVQPARRPGAGLLKLASLVALVFAAIQLTVAPIPWLPTISAAWQYDKLWSDALYKQISGYTLLALLLSALLLSLRKRVLGNVWGGYVTWRSVHSVLGFLSILVLTVHTGLRLGSGLNLLLASSLLALVFLGGLTGLLTAAASPGSSYSRFLRGALRCTHLCVAYLALLFVTFHVVIFYYF